MVSLCEVEFMCKRYGSDRSPIPGIRKCEHLKTLPVSRMRVLVNTKIKKLFVLCLFSSLRVFVLKHTALLKTIFLTYV